MNQKRQLKELSIEYSTLKEQDKSYILGVAKALSFAANNSCSSAKKSKSGESRNNTLTSEKPLLRASR